MSAASPQYHDLVKAVAWGLRHRCHLSAPAKILVAVSGGCDSVALLCALNLLRQRRNWSFDLAVGHVQHHLRGQASEDDAQFTEALADRLDLPCYRADLDLNAKAANLEALARQERYDALATLARTADATHIATAHHGDDQLETVLMRMLRGAGVTGLRGIAWKRTLPNASDLTLIRPMLRADRQQAADYLRTIDQPWREDHTNRDITRLRARLRHDVLPILHDIRADVPLKAVALAEHAQQMHQLLRAEVERHYEHVMIDEQARTFTLDRGEARLMPRVVLTALLRRLLTEKDVPHDRLGNRTLEPMVRTIRDRKGGRRTRQLSAGVTLEITKEQVTIG